ncbi:hypothetical protein [Halobellus rufus]|uniref:hypothetical protein n=1 Tax=Halobellus rufus TaxID=1448860 RepID=UPI0009DEEF88|nr:hypothetical protein [Halobellus rufus]
MFEEPTFLVQIGHNGHKLSQSLISQNQADGAILSPADFTKGKNYEIAQEINDKGGTVLFDPQYYIPRTKRPGLDTYDYFDDYGGDDFDTAMVSSRYEDLCSDIISVQDDLGTDAYIAPARNLDAFSDEKIESWVELTTTFKQVAEETGRDIPILASLPVYQKSLVDAGRRSELLNRVTQYDVDGFYVSAEFEKEQRHPLTGSSEVYSLLHLLNTLNKNRYEVVVGHTHQIAHLFFGIGINAFASGHYQNLRAFDTRRWDPQDEQGGGRLVVKYYSEEILNELRVDPELDLMYQKTDFDIETIRTASPYDEDLFDDSVPPSATGWDFREAAWDHYLWCCNQIAEKYRGLDEDERLDTAKEKLEDAEEAYNDVSDVFGMLSEPEPAIYSDWQAALSLIESDL